jgi:hypothetical protein
VFHRSTALEQFVTAQPLLAIFRAAQTRSLDRNFLPGQQLRQVVEIDGRLRVAVYLCRAVNNSAGELGWNLRVRPLALGAIPAPCNIVQSIANYGFAIAFQHALVRLGIT